MVNAIPVLAVVGRSSAGKTSVLVSLITECQRRGYRVATIKYVGRHDFDLDRPGKDSWRMAQAGSDAVAVISQSRLAIIKRTCRAPGLDDLRQALGPGFDLILAEGYMGASDARIEVHRQTLGTTLLSRPDDLLALVSDDALASAAPQFRSDEVLGLTDLIEDRLLRKDPS